MQRKITLPHGDGPPWSLGRGDPELEPSHSVSEGKSLQLVEDPTSCWSHRMTVASNRKDTV